MKYCVDTSSLLQLQRVYPQDVFPRLWEHVAALAADGRLISSEEVLLELKRKEGDVVSQWAQQHATIFLPPVEQIQNHVTQIMQQFPRLVDARAGKSFADPFVVATAVLQGCTVVTEEAPTGSTDRPKIPDVCRALKLQCIRLIQMIQQEKWQFS